MPTITINKKHLVHYAIMFAIMLAFWYMPLPGPVTRYGMKILGVFVALVWGWTFIDMLTPTLIGCFALAFVGLGTTEKVVMTLFNNSTVLLMLIGTIAFDVLRQTNASDFLLGKVLSSKIAKKDALYTVICIYAVVLVLSFLNMAILLQFVILPIMADFLRRCGYEKGDKFVTLFLIGYMIAYLLPIGKLPFMGWGLMICGSLQQIAQYAIPIGPYFIAQLVIYVLFLISYPLFMRMMGCDFSKLASVDVAEVFNFNENTKLNGGQKIALYGLIIYIAVVVFCSFAPVPFVKTAFAQITILGTMLVYWFVMLAVKVNDKPLLDMKEASANVNWNLLLVMALAIVVSNALTSADSGVSTWIAQLIAPLIANTGQITFLIVMAALLIFLTNIANNIAVVYILINVVSSLYMNGVEINLLATSLILVIGSCAVAFFTPASSVPGAILHSSSMIKTTELYKWNWVCAVYLLVLLMVVCIPIVLLGIGA